MTWGLTPSPAGRAIPYQMLELNGVPVGRIYGDGIAAQIVATLNWADALIERVPETYSDSTASVEACCDAWITDLESFVRNTVARDFAVNGLAPTAPIDRLVTRRDES